MTPSFPVKSLTQRMQAGTYRAEKSEEERFREGIATLSDRKVSELFDASGEPARKLALAEEILDRSGHPKRVRAQKVVNEARKAAEEREGSEENDGEGESGG